MTPEFLDKAHRVVEDNLSAENFGPEQLAKSLGMSHSTLHRHIKKASNKTISQFMRDIRLERAGKLLLTEESTIAEIAYNVGFGSVTYFNRCFHEHFGCAPGEYKKLQNQNSGKAKIQKKKLINRTGLVATFLLLILILGSILLNRLQPFSSDNQKEKSIAVMPFSFSGENPEKEYLSKGLEDNIISSLSKIGSLTVVNVFQEKNDSRTKISRQVAYFLDGTVHQAGDKYILAVKLTNTRNNHLEWSDKYDLNSQDIISTESEVAQSVAQKLHVSVTEKEKTLIEKKPTIIPDAYDFYQKGIAKHMEYWLDISKSDALQKAEYYYLTALKRDPDFALAYAGLARIALNKTKWSDIFMENYLDSVLILANKALTVDNTLADAYTLRGDYFIERDNAKANEEYQKALLYDPNNWQAYYGLSRYYLLENNIKSIEYLLEAAKRNRGDEYGLMLGVLVFEFNIYGLFEEADDFNRKKLEWDDDSTAFFARQAGIERYEGHYDKAIEYGLKAYKLDSSNIDITGALSFYYILNKDYRNALNYLNKVEYLLTFINFKRNNEHHRTGYVYLMNGDTLKAKEYFETQLEACNELLKSSQDESAMYDLAATYAILNQKEKAYETLIKFKDSDEISWFFYVFMKDDPLFQDLRNEAEFQQILSEVKDKATSTRDKLKAWFNQQGNS